MTESSSVQIRLDRIKLRFLSLLDERLDELELQIDDIKLPVRREYALSRIQSEAHKIAGTAAIVGFCDLGQIAAAVDTSIEEILAKACDKETIGQIHAQVEQLIEAGVLAVRSESAICQH